MITSNELRIGNLLFWNPKLSNPNTTLEAMQIEVWAILKDKIGYTFPGIEYRAEPFEDDLLQKEIRYKSLEELELVVLTPEILEMCGFKQEDDSFDRNEIFKNQNTPFLDVEINILEYKVLLRFTNGQTVELPSTYKFLNQLQNLYFILTGEELEINY
ncbi:MAG TPA: hypothetical protein VH396_01380 [Chitinophagaceae bacterium]|jgi:hypothetical protein